MMRDEVLKRRMRAERPETTPAFSAGVRRALSALPERKKLPVLRFVPASAVVFAAVALVCVGVFTFARGGNPPGQGGAAGSGAEQTAAGQAGETPCPTPTPLDSASAPATTADTEPQRAAMPEGLVIIGQGETKSKVKTAEYLSNLSLASQQIYGLMVLPGQSLSFRDIVLNKGIAYQQVPLDNVPIDAAPAGVTQVASTLYDAALLAGLDIVEWHPCDSPTVYVDKGLEASVTADGGKDLVIRNGFDGPVWISVKPGAEKGEIQIMIYGKAWEGEHPSELISKTVKTLPAPSQAPPADDNAVVTPPHGGYDVTVLRRWTNPDTKATRDETLYDVEYKPSAGGTQTTADDGGYAQTINETKTDNGISETLVEVGADPYALYAKFEFGPVSGDVTGNLVTSEVGGKWSTVSPFIETNPVKGKEGYYVTTYRLPLMGSFSSNVTFHSQIERNSTTPGEKNKILAQFKFDVSMNLWKGDGSDVAATGAGTLFYGNKATLLSVFQSPQDVAFRLALDDNEAGDLANYYNTHQTDNGDGSHMVLFGENSAGSISLAVYKGQASDGELAKILTPAEGDAGKQSFDLAKDRLFLKYIVMMLERGEDGKYYMNIVIINPALRADSDLCLISLNNPPDGASGTAQCSILQINVNKQDAPEPTPTPNTPDTTAMPQDKPDPTPNSQASPAPQTTADAQELKSNEFISKFLSDDIDLGSMKTTHPGVTAAFAYGDDASLQSVYQGPDAVIYELHVPDDKTGCLQKYYENHGGKEGNPHRIQLTQEQGSGLLIFTVCKGLVGGDYIGTTVSTEKYNVMVAACDDYQDHLYIRGIYAVLERNESGKFSIYIINMNPSYRPTGGFTILSRYYGGTADGGRKLQGSYALQISD